MRAARLTAFLLACVLAAIVAGGTAAMSAKHHPKKHPPKFNMRYDCSKVVPAKLINSFFTSWEGTVALKGKPVRNVYSGGGGSACTYVHVDGPFAGQHGGSVVVIYGPPAARLYKSDERTAKSHGARACANGNPSGDPRWCGPIELAGIGNHAYVDSAYIAAIKGKVFVQLEPGEGVANGQWIPSSTLPSQAALENAMQAILAKVR